MLAYKDHGETSYSVYNGMNIITVEGLHNRTKHLDIFFSAHHSVVFYFQCSVYWWKGSVRF